MPLNIIIDKSAFQSLSYDEMLRLTYYYKHNITPVLVMEILGDLNKEVKEGKTPSHQRVTDFATKLFPTNTIINQHYTGPLKGELCGDGAIAMDGRPLVGLGKAVQTEDGKKGWLVEETDEEKAIYNWREGRFSEADHMLSKLWRNTTKQEDLLINLKKELEAKSKKITVKNFQQLDQLVTATLDNPENAQQLLIDLSKTSEVNILRAMAILKAWQHSGGPPLKHFVPYAYHILRVNTLFQVGLQCDLISTRPTNKVDLEYLYYLPFCQIFTSNDNLHLNLAPLLLRKGQYFIKGTELKEDMHRINQQLAEMPEEQRMKFRKAPPVDKDSFTFQRYHEYFDYPDGFQWQVKATKLEKADALKMMMSFEKANAGPAIDMKNGDDGMFMTRVTLMSRNDPCSCGSGKRLTECCITDQQFDDALKAQGAGKSVDKIKIGSANWMGEE
jgi:hypothetical protein